MKVFVVNLESSRDRRAFMEKQLAELGIEHEFFPAVDGRKFSQEELPGLCDAKWFRRYLGRDMTRGDLGCSLSHIHIYKKMVEEGLPCALILEDDAWLTPSMKQIVEALEADIQRLPVDVVLFSECVTSPKNMWQAGSYFMSFVVHAIFTHAYVITNQGAQNLLKALFPVCHPADAWDWLLRHRQIRLAAIHPVLATQNQAALNTTNPVGCQAIGKTYSAAWFRHKVLRAFWKMFDNVVPVSWHRKF